MSREMFGSRYALIAAGIGMAVGVGNLWRFPRVVAEWGGGTFLIVLLLASVVWAVPLLMAESLMGSKSRLGTVGAFRDFMGRRFAWMGGFMGLCTIGILFYYSVVCGWALRYFALSLTGTFSDPDTNTEQVWTGFVNSPVQPVLFHLIAILLVGVVVYRGLKRGFEGVLKIALPALLVILVILMVRAVTLPGAGEGLRYLFVVNPADFGEARVWLEAFTQIAFSTGAGWGLYLTYAVYSRRREDIAGNAVIVTAGDLVAALMAGVAVLCTMFALSSVAFAQQAFEDAGAMGEGMAFVYFTQLLGEMPGGVVFTPLFFLALALAGLSSLIAMVELATRNVVDMGVSRQRAVIGVVVVAFLAGIPSAISMEFFSNQDYVWGVGLLLSGLFASVAMLKYGVGRARADITALGGLRIGAWFAGCIRLFPAVFAVLMGWWMYRAVTDFAPDTWWNPLDGFSLATLLAQWGLLVLVLILLNGWLSRTVRSGPMSGGEEPEGPEERKPEGAES